MLSKYKIPIYLFVLFAVSYFLAIPDVKYDRYFTAEDSWIENITALAFLIAAILFYICFWQSKGRGNKIFSITTNRNYIYFFLALLFFVAFGEEISWGQRIFGWSTPEALAAANFQNETNIHNLDIFTFKDEVGDGFWSTLLIITPGRLFFYFWFSFLVLLPLLSNSFSSIQKLVKKINIPVPPIWFGVLMILNLVLSKFYIKMMANYSEEVSGSIGEIKEGNYAIVIAVLAIYFYHNRYNALSKK